ncbi:hypothetical protein PROFUN_08889 [Planoprotostelium fungivorum]|uniref:Uncharacterized protein n=1 Tax=Planoprotostelium fungivorum TaxID=1890364 RepID=A0A2P6NIR5_9EUKA|nr:hypothetical protein PROFUN_08889 [Planoprotostelium fungivorum]
MLSLFKQKTDFCDNFPETVSSYDHWIIYRDRKGSHLEMERSVPQLSDDVWEFCNRILSGDECPTPSKDGNSNVFDTDLDQAHFALRSATVEKGVDVAFADGTDSTCDTFRKLRVEALDDFSSFLDHVSHNHRRSALDYKWASMSKLLQFADDNRDATREVEEIIRGVKKRKVSVPYIPRTELRAEASKQLHRDEQSVSWRVFTPGVGSAGLQLAVGRGHGKDIQAGGARESHPLPGSKDLWYTCSHPPKLDQPGGNGTRESRGNIIDATFNQSCTQRTEAHIYMDFDFVNVLDWLRREDEEPFEFENKMQPMMTFCRDSAGQANIDWAEDIGCVPQQAEMCAIQLHSHIRDTAHNRKTLHKFFEASASIVGYSEGELQVVGMQPRIRATLSVNTIDTKKVRGKIYSLLKRRQLVRFIVLLKGLCGNTEDTIELRRVEVYRTPALSRLEEASVLSDDIRDAPCGSPRSTTGVTDVVKPAKIDSHEAKKSKKDKVKPAHVKTKREKNEIHTNLLLPSIYHPVWIPSQPQLYRYYLRERSLFHTILSQHSVALVEKQRQQNLVEGRGVINLLPHSSGRAGSLIRLLPGSTETAILQLHASDLQGKTPDNYSVRFTFIGGKFGSTMTSTKVDHHETVGNDFVHIHFVAPRLQRGIRNEHGRYGCTLADARGSIVYTFKSPENSMAFGGKTTNELRVLHFLNGRDECIYRDMWDKLPDIMPNGFVEELQRVYDENGPHANEGCRSSIRKPPGHSSPIKYEVHTKNIPEMAVQAPDRPLVPTIGVGNVLVIFPHVVSSSSSVSSYSFLLPPTAGVRIRKSTIVPNFLLSVALIITTHMSHKSPIILSQQLRQILSTHLFLNKMNKKCGPFCVHRAPRAHSIFEIPRGDGICAIQLTFEIQDTEHNQKILEKVISSFGTIIGYSEGELQVVRMQDGCILVTLLVDTSKEDADVREKEKLEERGGTSEKLEHQGDGGGEEVQGVD